MSTINCSDPLLKAGKAVVAPFFQTPMRSAATISSISSLAAYFIFDCSLNNSAYTGLAIITVAGAIRYFSNLNKPSIPKAPPPPPLSNASHPFSIVATKKDDRAGAKASKGVVATPPSAKKGVVHRAPEADKRGIEDDMTLLLSFHTRYRPLTSALSYANEPSNATCEKLRSKCGDLQVDWDKFRNLFRDFPGILDRYYQKRLDGLKELIRKDTALKARPLPPTPPKKNSPRGSGKLAPTQEDLSNDAPKPITTTSPKPPEKSEPKKFPEKVKLSPERMAFLLQESLKDERSTVTTAGLTVLQYYCKEFGINWEAFIKLAQLEDENKRLKGLLDLVSEVDKRKNF